MHDMTSAGSAAQRRAAPATNRRHAARAGSVLAAVLSVTLNLALTLAAPASAAAAIPGAHGTLTGAERVFRLTARDGYISVPEGSYVYMWGYADADGSGVMQYPGPTLIVDQGDRVVVQLTNQLSEPVSIVFPGQTGVTGSGGAPGLLAREAAPGETVEYAFVATMPGTFQYHSGTRPDLQIEMGLVGALVVRPPTAGRAYLDEGTEYDREFLLLLTEIDPQFHDLVEFGYGDWVDTTEFYPVMWFINGRAAPDTMLMDGAPWLPTQPYGAMVRMHPGETILLRFVGAGRDLHPFHTHGNNLLLIARDGRVLQSRPGVGPDLAESEFTQTVAPGETLDALFTWTGAQLGWDIYGTVAENPHTCTPDAAGFDPDTHEWCADHDRPFPVVLPEQQDLTFGGMWSGSPYLGGAADLPPGDGGFNSTNAYFFMWHSHNEKEMTSFDAFPGGMMTMLAVEHPDVDLDGMGGSR